MGFFVAEKFLFLYDIVMKEYKNILVIKLGALGDFIQKTGCYAAIRKNWPNAKITLLTGRAFLKIAQSSGCFDAYVEDNRTWCPLDYIRIIRMLVGNKYDLIIDLQMQRRTKERYYALTRLWANHSFDWASFTRGAFFIRHILDKPRCLWGKSSESQLKLDIPPASLAFCKASPDVLALLPQQYVLLIPGCSPAHPYKRWPAASYRELALRLGKMDIPSVVLGTSAEQKEIETICSDNPKAINFCNKSALLDIPQIAAQSMAIVGNDTGPQHMAELGSVHAVTLFCEVTKKSAIYRPNITNLFGKEITDISVDAVFNVLQSLWHKA